MRYDYDFPVLAVLETIIGWELQSAHKHLCKLAAAFLED